MSNISEDLEYSNDQDVREFINKVKVLYKSSDRKNVIKAFNPAFSAIPINKSLLGLIIPPLLDSMYIINEVIAAPIIAINGNTKIENSPSLL